MLQRDFLKICASTALVLCTALALSGCGGGDDSADKSADTPDGKAAVEQTIKPPADKSQDARLKPEGQQQANNQNAAPSQPQQGEKAPAATSNEPVVARVCRATIANANSYDVKNVTTYKVENDVAYVAHSAQPGSPASKNRCKLDGDQVVWGEGETGAWHDQANDPDIKYAVDGAKVTVTEVFAGGITLSNQFEVN